MILAHGFVTSSHGEQSGQTVVLLAVILLVVLVLAVLAIKELAE